MIGKCGAHLDEQLHHLSEAAGHRPLCGAADDDAEQAAEKPQIAAGVGVQLLRVPPRLTWQTDT